VSSDTTAEKTIPIQDVWMFLWRFLFAPIVIAGSFAIPISVYVLFLLAFLLAEILVIIFALIWSPFSDRWLIKDWTVKVYKGFLGVSEWYIFEWLRDLPTQWWEQITEPGVRRTLSHFANWLSLILWFGGNFAGMFCLDMYLCRLHIPHGHEPYVIWAIFGLGLAWGGLWLLKTGLEYLLR